MPSQTQTRCNGWVINITMKKFDVIIEQVYADLADLTIYKNPTISEYKQGFRVSKRGTTLWYHNFKDNPWYFTGDDVIHDTLAFSAGCAVEDCALIYARYPEKKMILSFNYIDYDDKKARGEFPYEKMVKNEYWNLLADTGWVFSDHNGDLDKDAFISMSEKSKQESATSRKDSTQRALDKILNSDKDLLKKLGINT